MVNWCVLYYLLRHLLITGETGHNEAIIDNVADQAYNQFTIDEDEIESQL